MKIFDKNFNFRSSINPNLLKISFEYSFVYTNEKVTHMPILICTAGAVKIKNRQICLLSGNKYSLML